MDEHELSRSDLDVRDIPDAVFSERVRRALVQLAAYRYRMSETDAEFFIGEDLDRYVEGRRPYGV